MMKRYSHLLKGRDEKIQVVYFWDLLDKFREAAHKLLGIEIVKHIEVKTVFAAVDKGGSVSAPISSA